MLSAFGELKTWPLRCVRDEQVTSNAWSGEHSNSGSTEETIYCPNESGRREALERIPQRRHSEMMEI